MTTQTVSLSKDEKIKHVIDLTEQGKSLEDISDELGYSQPKNLIRFMARSQFKFDADHHRFIHQANRSQKKEDKRERPEPAHQEVSDDKNEERQDEKESLKVNNPEEVNETNQLDITDETVNLLKNENVLELLHHARDVLEAIQDKKEDNNGEDMNSKSLSMSQMYKDAQFYHRQVTSVTKSFRVPVDLDSRLQDFCELTGLNQKQVVCLAIDYFLNQQDFLEKFSEEEHKDESPT